MRCTAADRQGHSVEPGAGRRALTKSRPGGWPFCNGRLTTARTPYLLLVQANSVQVAAQLAPAFVSLFGCFLRGAHGVRRSYQPLCGDAQQHLFKRRHPSRCPAVAESGIYNVLASDTATTPVSVPPGARSPNWGAWPVSAYRLSGGRRAHRRATLDLGVR